jgi:signal transduction histidine kinase
MTRQAPIGTLGAPQPADRRWRLDAVIALVVFALTLALLARRGDASRGLDPLGVVLAAFASLPLLARRRAPLSVFALCTAASATINALGYPLAPPLGPTIALFFLANDDRTEARLRQIGIVVITLFAVHVGATTSAHHGFPTTPVLGGIILWGGAWIVGDQLRQRRRRLADLRERACRAQRELERERRLAAAEERTRIARDLHDSAAHAINVILVQAGGARLVQERDPVAVARALSTIEDVARETIEEIDQLIRNLRAEDGREPAPEAVEAPAALAALEALADRHRAAGRPITVRIQGRPRPLAPGLDQAAYRILQESLTNAARYGTGSAEVEVTYAEAQLELSISNRVVGTAGGQPTAGGHGILGMRERTALFGGSLATAASAGRFRVRARLPYPPAAPPR